ncbi:uncharacterized protein LOC142332399 [Lycorma delicatula]|uniref:uncharacterized protein LOC142332399 n=1 Tax=Lycorma delicatula TaxID=130591 RepID=UPI003F510581
MANRDGIPLYTSLLILLLTHCYSVFAILDKKVLYVEDEPRRNYRVEDFLWTGSGDGEPERSSTWKTTTVFRTTTTTVLIATALISPTPVITTVELPRTTIITSCSGDGQQCQTIKPTPTLDLPPATVLPPWPPPAPPPPPDKRYWLVTVLKANLSSEELGSATKHFEPKLGHLYKTAFQRHQFRHLGVNGNNNNGDITNAAMIKRRSEERPLTVRVLNVTSSPADSTLRLVYAIRIDGRPVVASAAAADMKLLSDKEVTAELGFPVITKAEPYLPQPGEPVEGVGLTRHRDTWLLVSASVCAVLLLLILIVIIILGLGKRKRKQRRIEGSANRGRVFEREQQKKKHRRKASDNGGGPADNMAFQPDDENDDKQVVSPDSPGHLSFGASSAASLVRRTPPNAPVPHPRPRPRSHKPSSPHSYLSMPSVKQFPSGPPLAEPLEQVLESQQRPLSSYTLARHRSHGEGEDPGVIGPLVWDLHCHRLHKQDCVDVMPDEDLSLNEPNVGRMRRRFQELLDDAFSLFGSRSGSPEQDSSTSTTNNHDFRAKSALVRPVCDGLGTETIMRPKTSASAILQRPATASVSRPPKGAWDNSIPSTPPSRPPPRPLSAGPFHRPSLEPAHILSDANLSPSDPAVPLIAAIQEELDKFAPVLPGTPPYKV